MQALSGTTHVFVLICNYMAGVLRSLLEKQKRNSELSITY